MNYLSGVITFVTIAEHGSFKKAAVQLCKTEAAISKKLKSLEDALEVELIVRDKSGVYPSKIGAEYLILCKEWLSKFDETHELIKSTKSEPSGELKIFFKNHIIYEKLILPNLKDFLDKYPKIVLSVFTESSTDYKNQQIDICFDLFDNSNNYSNLISKTFIKSKLIACMNPQYFDISKHKFRELEDLKIFPYLLFKNNKNKLKPSLIFDDLNSTINSALAGLGFIIIEEVFVRDYLKSGKLLNILTLKEDHKISIYYKRQTYLNPRIKKFVDFFVEKENF